MEAGEAAPFPKVQAAWINQLTDQARSTTALLKFIIQESVSLNAKLL